MGKKKQDWLIVGLTVEHKKTGQVGKVLEVKDKPHEGRVRWSEDDQEQWVDGKKLKQVLAW